MNAGNKDIAIKFVFVGLFLITALPFVTSPVALILGFAASMLLGNPNPELTSSASKTLLKVSVVGLGFGVNFLEVIRLGKDSLLLTLVTILFTVGIGALLSRFLRIPGNTGSLISFGTAICGGSAIAAMAPVLKAKSDEVAIALATVFSLNALALLVFPAIGSGLHLSQQEFGLWSALAIHDTSSVVGATATYGTVALAVGTTAKLTRALWIAPCTLAVGLFKRSQAKVGIPLFIIGFVAAAFVNTSTPGLEVVWSNIYLLARQLLVMTLFLVGASLSREMIREIGLRPFFLGLLLWGIVSMSTLGLILAGLIS